MKTFIQEKTVLLFLISLVGCGGDGGSATGATETGNSIGAAVQSVFGGSDESSSLNSRSQLVARLADLFLRQARAEDGGGPQTTCGNLGNSPDGVSTGASIEAGTYGVPSNAITVSATDDCEDGGEYASFTVSSHSLNCTDGSGNASTVTMVDSSGVWRENVTTNQTEIYGTFNIQAGGETASDIRCSLVIDHDEGGGSGEFSGDCADADGNAIDQSTDLTCTDSEGS